jgi:putative transposase
MLILNEQHLYRLLDEYVTFFKHAHPHQGLNQRIPVPPKEDIYRIRGSDSDHRIVSYPVLGGLHHDYRRAA